MGEATAAALLTAEEFAALPDNNMRQELIAGRVVDMPLESASHGALCAVLLMPLGLWLHEHPWGWCACNYPGIILARSPDTVRAPDAAYYAAARLPRPPHNYYPDIPPDLVLEVVSEVDRTGDVLAKVGQWLNAGVQVVWVAWPSSTLITVYGPGDEIRLLGQGDTLTCESLLPGFALPIREVFPA